MGSDADQIGAEALGCLADGGRRLPALRYFNIRNYPASFCLGRDERSQLFFEALGLANRLAVVGGRATWMESMKKAYATAAVKR